MKINAGMIIAVVIHIFITLLLFSDPDKSQIGFLGLAVVIGNILGILLVAIGKKEAGYKTFMISSFVLVPIGLIGAKSARKELDEIKNEKFKDSLED
ncbi:hypothetical protein OAT16_01820 [Prolixibacteraceae bacterium]|nr:hypothetical protein [Prolixibacteraceae bacterium]